MKFSIPVKPLSVNAAYRGRRFKSKDYEQFEEDVSLVLGRAKQNHTGELFVKYTFYIKNYSRSDTANFEKVLSDTLTKLGYFADDNDIKGIFMVKEKVDKEEHIMVEIVPYDQLSTVLL